MQTLFKPNLFSNSSSKVGAKNFVSGGKKLGSSIVGAARNNIIGFNRTAQAMVPQKKEENENSFIKNYTNFFGSKKTEKILRKNLKLVRDSLVNTFEIARHLKAAIIGIAGDLKGGAGKGGGGILSKLAMFTSLVSLLLNPTVWGILGILAAGGIAALLLNEKTRKAIMNFLEYQLPKFWDWFKPRIINLVKSMMPWIPDWMWNITQDESTTKVKARVEEVGVEQTLLELREELNSKRWDLGARLNGEIAEIKEQIFMLEQGQEKQYGVKGWDFLQGVPGMTEEMRLKRIQIRTERENSPDNDGSREYNKETNALIKEEMKKIKAKWKKWGDEDQKHGLPRRDKHMILKDVNLAKEQQEKRIQLAKEGNPAYEMYLPKNQSIEGKKSDVNNLDLSKFYSDNLNESSFNFEPITFDLSQAQDSSGGITNTSGGNTSGGDGVTFYSSSNSDPSYHKLNALLTFNVV